MKKKITLIATCLSLVALLAVGATLAWFTDASTATNVVTTGNVDITLTETKADGSTTVDGDGISYDGMPGSTLSKDPTITNVGKNDAYIRASIEVAGTGEAYSKLTPDQKTIVDTKLAALLNSLTINTKFEKNGDYYYYNGVMAKTASEKLFTQVVIPSTWGNEMSDISFNIVVKAEAVQVDNFLPTGTTFSVSALATAWAAL